MSKEKRFKKVVEWEDRGLLFLGIWIAIQNTLTLIIIDMYNDFEHLIEYTSFQGAVILIFMASLILLYILSAFLICKGFDREVYYREKE